MSWQRAASAVVSAFVFASTLGAQSTSRASVSSAGVEGNKESRRPSISADGRYIAFESLAKTLVTGDTNQRRDIFVHDRQTAQTVCASVASTGAQSGGNSEEAALSADGRFVVFQSLATNLVAGDTNNFQDIFVRDLASGTTERASVGSTGAQANGESFEAAVSGDGRYVVFATYADTLAAPSALAGLADIYLRDRASGQTTLVTAGYALAAGSSYNPTITPDGRFVAFQSSHATLVPNDTNGFLYDIFVYDTLTQVFTRENVSATGVESDSHSYEPSLSDDGRFVAFESDATTLVPYDSNQKRDVFVRDRVSATIDIVSAVVPAFPGNGWSGSGVLSGDGRYVVFASESDNLVPADFNGIADVFLHDRLTHANTRVSVDSLGGENLGWVTYPVISGDGRTVAFESLGTTLVPNDTNEDWDIFARAPVTCGGQTYCTAGTTSNGCAPAITSTGTPSANATSGFTIAVHGVEGQRAGLIFYGVSGRQNLAWATGSTSFLCVALPTQRMSAQSSAGTLGQCDGVLSEDWSAFVATHPSALGRPFAVGQTVNAQGWFRDPPSPKHTSLSDGLDFVVCP